MEEETGEELVRGKILAQTDGDWLKGRDENQSRCSLGGEGNQLNK